MLLYHHFIPSADWCKVGIGICYDLRFPELASLYALKGTSCMYLNLSLILNIIVSSVFEGIYGQLIRAM